MDYTLSNILRTSNKSEWALMGLFILYLIMGVRTPSMIAGLIDSLPGKIGLVLVVLYLFLNFSPVLGVLSVLVAYELLRRSMMATGKDAVTRFAPSEAKKSSHLTAFNQFPYTLEQEVVAKMAPLSKPGFSMTQASYKPMLDNTYDATPLNA